MEPPNRGHLGEKTFVLISEVVLILKVLQTKYCFHPKNELFRKVVINECFPENSVKEVDLAGSKAI